nr:MAG TPA: hypothetical protein [Caudoviricetes sp.]
MYCSAQYSLPHVLVCKTTYIIRIHVVDLRHKL